MTKREARKRALADAADMLQAAAEGGWPEDADDADTDKLQAAMQGIANRLGLQFARLVAADVRRKRRSVHTTPEAQ